MESRQRRVSRGDTSEAGLQRASDRHGQHLAAEGKYEAARALYVQALRYDPRFVRRINLAASSAATQVQSRRDQLSQPCASIHERAGLNNLATCCSVWIGWSRPASAMRGPSSSTRTIRAYYKREDMHVQRKQLDDALAITKRLALDPQHARHTRSSPPVVLSGISRAAGRNTSGDPAHPSWPIRSRPRNKTGGREAISRERRSCSTRRRSGRDAAHGANAPWSNNGATVVLAVRQLREILSAATDRQHMERRQRAPSSIDVCALLASLPGIFNQLGHDPRSALSNAIGCRACGARSSLPSGLRWGLPGDSLAEGMRRPASLADRFTPWPICPNPPGQCAERVRRVAAACRSLPLTVLEIPSYPIVAVVDARP